MKFISHIFRPLVGLIQPFVADARPFIKPFVDQKQPFVPIGAAKNSQGLRKAYCSSAGTLLRRLRIAGFTLIEAMIVLVIIAILISWALPNFERMLKEGKVNSATNELVAAINYARTEAITRFSQVGLCRTNVISASIESDPACNLDSEGSDYWGEGWLVYSLVSATTNGVFYNDALGHELLRTGSNFRTSGIEIGTITPGGEKVADILTIRPDGGLNQNDHPSTTTVAFFVCDPDGDVDGRSVTVSLLGQVSIANYPAGSTCAF